VEILIEPDLEGTLVQDCKVPPAGVGNVPAVADNFSFGNVFGPCPLPFTVTDLSLFMVIVNSSTAGSGNAFVTVFGPLNTAGTNASPITSPLVALRD